MREFEAAPEAETTWSKCGHEPPKQRTMLGESGSKIG